MIDQILKNSQERHASALLSSEPIASPKKTFKKRKKQNQSPTANRQNYRNMSSHYKPMLFHLQHKFFRQKFGLQIDSVYYQHMPIPIIFRIWQPFSPKKYNHMIIREKKMYFGILNSGKKCLVFKLITTQNCFYITLP